MKKILRFLSVGLLLSGSLTAYAAPLSGEYTVGEGFDYASLQDAVSALQTEGMEGAVTLLLQDGTYSEYVTIPAGITSAAHTLTIKADGDVRFSGDDGNGNAYITVQAPYVTIDGISFNSGDATKDATKGYMVNVQADNFTIMNCTLDYIGNLAAGQWGDQNPTTVMQAKNVKNFLAKDCRFIGSLRGLHFCGTDNDGITLDGCEFTKQGKWSVSCGDPYCEDFANSKAVNVKVNKCTFINDYSTWKTSSGYVAIGECFGKSGNNELSNSIFLTKHFCCEQVCLLMSSHRGNWKIYNNAAYIESMASDGTDPVCFVEIKDLRKFPTKVELYHNTVYINQIQNPSWTTKRSGVLFFDDALMTSADALIVENNIFETRIPNSSRTSGVGAILNTYTYYVEKDQLTSMLALMTNFRNNAISVPTDGYVFNSEDFPELNKTKDTWTGKDYFIQVPFTSASSSSMSLVPTDYFGLRKGNIIAGVETDQNGRARTSGHTTFGAYECPDEYVAPAPLAGTYYIGKSERCNYSSFKYAMRDLSEYGVSGPVRFEVEAGEYSGKLTLGAIPGVSADNTVTFASETGDAADVVITLNEYSGLENYSSNLEGDIYGVVNLQNADYVKFENLTFHAGAEGPFNLIILRDGSDHFTVDGCSFKSERKVSQSSVSGNHIMAYDKVENKYLTVLNSRFEGNSCGYEHNDGNVEAFICLSGTSSNDFRDKKTDDVIIEGNTFINGYYAVNCNEYANNLSVKGNSFEINCDYVRNAKEPHPNYYGIRVQSNDVNSVLKISGNTFRNIGRNANNIYMIDLGFNNCKSLEITNNTAHYSDLTAASGKEDFVYITSTVNNLLLANNTVLFEGESPNSGALFMEGTYAKLNSGRIVNNIFYNNAGGSVYEFTENNTNLTFGHNVYANADNVAATGSSIKNFADWTEFAGETGSEVMALAFGTDLQVAEADRDKVTGMAMGLPEVETDILGKQRDLDAPTVGAFEYDFILKEADIFVDNEDFTDYISFKFEEGTTHEVSFKVPAGYEIWYKFETSGSTQSDIVLKAQSAGKDGFTLYDDSTRPVISEKGTLTYYAAHKATGQTTAEHKLLFGDNTVTGIGNVGIDVEAEYYTLDGQRVAASMLQPGIYIIRRAGKSTKCVIR